MWDLSHIPICWFHYLNTPKKHKQILCFLEKQDCISNLHNIITQGFKNLVKLGLYEDITFDDFFLDLKLDENTYKN
jgi:hypothetical protein